MTEDVKPKELEDLGWANGWDKDDPRWERVKKCSELGHVRSDIDVGPPNRGLEHVVTCRICGFVYRYDCSD